MIRLSNVCKHYGKAPNTISAARDLAFSVDAGEFIAITGPSGAGKTTLLNLIAGMTNPDSGTIEVAGARVDQLGDRERTRLRADTIGFACQSANLLATLNVLENVLLPARFCQNAVDPAYADELLAAVGLAGRKAAFAHELSAGQQRRVAIARALITRPRLLLCDEPTNDLDEETADTILKLIVQAHQRGATVLLVTHQRGPCELATRVLRIVDGQVFSPGA